MKTKLLLSVCLCFWIHIVQAQYDFYTNTAHTSLVKAIAVNSDVIKARTLAFEKKAEAKPLMFVNTKKKIGALNWVSNNLTKYIKELQSQADNEKILYELIDEDFYEKLLFDTRGNLNANGKKLKVKIDSLYFITTQVNNHRLTNLSDFANNHFKTSRDYYDPYQKKIDYFKHFFTDKSNYGMMMQMYCLLLDVKTFQLLYYQTVMSF